MNFINNITCRINNFRPQILWKSIFIKYDSCHLLKYFIFPFNISILLWSARSRKLMFNFMLFTICNERVVYKFTTSITTNTNNGWIFFLFNSFAEDIENMKKPHLYVQERKPCVSWIVIDKHTHTQCVPPKLLVLIGPNMSICVNSKGRVDTISLICLKEVFVYFPNWQALQIWSFSNFN